MQFRDELIRLGQQLADERNEAFNLWTWLPSYRNAVAAHGDYAGNFMPSVRDVLVEAETYLSHNMAPTAEQMAQDGDIYACPCGDDHTP